MKTEYILTLALTMSCSCTQAGPPVEHHRELVAQRAAVFGAAEGEGALSAVFDVDVGPDGSVYVSEPGFARVVSFRPDGAFDRTIGRRGSGPGEYQAPGNLSWRADTLTILDFRSGISLFDTDGRFHRQIDFSVEGENQAFPLSPMALLVDGTVASFAPTPTSAVLEGRVTRELWLKMSGSGDVLDTLVSRRLVGNYFEYETDRGSRSSSHPLATGQLIALPPNGSFLVLADRAWSSDGLVPSYHLSRINLEGDTVVGRAVTYAAVDVTTADRDSIAASLTSLAPTDEGYARSVRAIREGIPWPDQFPPLSAVVAGDDGSVWVQRHESHVAGRRWDVFNGDLEPAGTVVLPDDFNVKVVGLRSIYGVELDSLDVPWVVRYDILEK